jgi:hypothetical protein
LRISSRTSSMKPFVLVIKFIFPISSNSNYRHLLSYQSSAFLMARQEGLEPPTDGFGDRYSTN